MSRLEAGVWLFTVCSDGSEVETCCRASQPPCPGRPRLCADGTPCSEPGLGCSRAWRRVHSLSDHACVHVGSAALGMSNSRRSERPAWARQARRPTDASPRSGTTSDPQAVPGSPLSREPHSAARRPPESQRGPELRGRPACGGGVASLWEPSRPPPPPPQCSGALISVLNRPWWVCPCPGPWGIWDIITAPQTHPTEGAGAARTSA